MQTINSFDFPITHYKYESWGLTPIALHGAEVRTYIAEPDRGRRRWQDKPDAQAAVYANRRRIQGEHRKQLLRRRGELLERSFALAYETGGIRRVYLRGRPECFEASADRALNLSLVMRKWLGKGTPRGRQGFTADAMLALMHLWLAVLVHTEESNTAADATELSKITSATGC